jgi:hypothetical protein
MVHPRIETIRQHGRVHGIYPSAWSYLFNGIRLHGDLNRLKITYFNIVLEIVQESHQLYGDILTRESIRLDNWNSVGTD